MSRPKTAINPECGKRLSILIEEQRINQTELANKIPLSQQTISKIINGKANTTAPVAERLKELYPQYTLDWLMGKDSPKTTFVEFLQNTEAFCHRYESIFLLLKASAEEQGYKVVEWIPVPPAEGYDISIIRLEGPEGERIIKSGIAKEILDFIDYKMDRLIKEATSHG